MMVAKMTTKILYNPRNLTITTSCSPKTPPTPSHSNNNRRLIFCLNLSFRRPKLYYPPPPPPPPPHNNNIINNRYPQQPRPVRAFSLPQHHDDDDQSPDEDDDDDGAHKSCSSSTLKDEEDGEDGDAREAVSEILQEFGASKEDSIHIAMRSPKYLAMLVESVRDLDDLSLWNSWSRRRRRNDDENIGKEKEEEEEEEEKSLLSLKEKVYYMGMEKGDKGMLPFLESLGMTLPSATHLARYLSSQTLPNLIHKVKYVKEMFFSNSDDKGLIGKNARRMMMYLSISVDEDVQQTLSFFEKIEARRGGLDVLGSQDASFRYLIESFPRLLLLSLESHMKPLVEFLEDIGVPRGCMRNILLLFPPIFFYDIEKDIKPRIQAFQKVDAGNKDFGRMLLKYPWILSTGIQENYEEILSFFDMEKVPKVSIDLAIKSWPLLLGCSIGKLNLMVQQFGELGVRNKKLGQVIATSPQLLLRKPQEFLQVVSFLKDLGLDEETIGSVLGRCPEIFATSIERTLNKKLDFFSTIGISKSHLPRVIRKYPELFVCDVDRTLLPRMTYLMKTGLSQRDVAFMVRRFSPLLGYSIEEVLRPKLEFLVNTMEKPLKEVVDYPRYFSYSLERKIKPRYWVLKGRSMEECSLKDMLGKNDEEFAAELMGVGIVSPPPNLQ
ncbi:transcription termination factor MTERF4, chloroplastic [Camellia sinensis]|uniref:transcription termination factor MTERF4, chloroplastic n=1 Tax=Camellia sinensis TaxID=4442 RepID=UPI00103695EA|nr:transcription termination factor MTERF4, chloroplastic [Camellia sinensis]